MLERSRTARDPLNSH